MAKIDLKSVEQQDLVNFTALIVELAKVNSLESIGFLTSMIINYANQHGLEEALSRITDAPDLFLDVVRLKLERKSPKTSQLNRLEKVLSVWGANNAAEYVEKLKLTQYQALTIYTIHKQKNKASLDDIKKAFKKQGIDADNGSMVGGSLAGLSKKCEAYGIPALIKSVRGSNSQDVYSFVPMNKKAMDLIIDSIKPIVSSM